MSPAAHFQMFPSYQKQRDNIISWYVWFCLWAGDELTVLFPLQLGTIPPNLYGFLLSSLFL